VTDQADRILAVLSGDALTTTELRRAFRTAGWPWTMETDKALLDLRVKGRVAVAAGRWRAKGLTERME